MPLPAPIIAAQPLRRVAAAWALFGAVAAAAAAPAATDRCAGSADEASLLRCRQAQFNGVGNRLRQVLERLQQRYQDDEAERGKLLSASQQAWRTHLQAECRFRTFESAAGSAYQAYLLTCLTDLSERRLQDLNRVLATP